MPNLPVRTLLFLSSYSPLFLILAVKDGCTSNPWLWVFAGVGVGSILVIPPFLAVARGREPHVIKIDNVEPRGTEAMSYLVTYLIPFLNISIHDKSDLAALSILLVMIGILYVNSNLIYINPILSALGINLFEVRSDAGKTSALLTRRNYFQRDEEIRVVSLGNYVLMEKT